MSDYLKIFQTIRSTILIIIVIPLCTYLNHCTKYSSKRYIPNNKNKKRKLVKPPVVDTPDSVVIGIKDEKRNFKPNTTDDISDQRSERKVYLPCPSNIPQL